MQKDSVNTILSSAKKFFLGTFLTRFSGMLRDIIMAAFFGSSPHIALFMVSFRFANLFRRLLGEGTLPQGFIPYFETIRKEDPVKATAFYRDAFFSTGAFLISLVIVLSMFCYGLMRFLDAGNVRSIVFLSMLMLPGLVFICLYAINSAYLQCHKTYFLPAVAPIAFNFTWILAILLLRKLSSFDAAKGLSIGIVAAFFFQWLMTHFKSAKFFSAHIPYRQMAKPVLFSKEVKSIIKPITLNILGVGAVQLNTALDSFFALSADPSGPVYLWYSMRLQMLPLSMFGIALSSALLPPLTRAFQNNDMQSYRTYFNDGVCKTIGLMLSCTVAIFVLGGASITLLFGRGYFDDHTIRETTFCLWAYGSGLLFTVLTFIFAAGFYSRKQYKKPTMASLISVVVNLTLNFIFVYILHMKTISIAIATSLSALVNCAVLLFFLIREQKALFDKKIFISIYRAIFCSFVGAAMAIAMGIYLKDPSISMLLKPAAEYIFTKTFIMQSVNFFLITISFFGGFLISAYLTKATEILDLLSFGNKKTEKDRSLS